MSGFQPREWQEKLAQWQAGSTPEWGTEGNRLTNVGGDGGQATTHAFDQNGNLKQEFTNRHFAWYAADRLSKLLRAGGIRAVAAESLLVKHQILSGNRARRRVAALQA